MNKRIAGTVGLCVIGAGLSVAAAETVAPNDWDFRALRAGPVYPHRGDFTQLKGRFTVIRDARGGLPVTERSHGSGGACLIADLAPHGAPEQSCTSHAQCNSAWANYHTENLGNPNYDAAKFGQIGNGYCVANRCWYRPGSNACVRRPFPNVWEIQSHEFGPLDVEHVERMYGTSREVDWRVLTCANRAQVNGTDAGSCALSAGIYDTSAR